MAPETPAAAESILLVGMPLLLLQEAADRCSAAGTAVLPAGGPGDLPRAGSGTEVLFVAGDADERPAPAATWEAELVGLVDASPGSFPEGLPPSWIADRREAAGTDVARSRFGDDEDEEHATETTQTYFAVRALHELPSAERVHVNELVPKQERGGRTFFPLTPRLVARPT